MRMVTVKRAGMTGLHYYCGKGRMNKWMNSKNRSIKNM